MADDRLATNIRKLKEGMRFLAEKPLREWFGRAKEESKLEALGQNAICILEQLFPLVGAGGWYDGPKIMKEGGEFESRRVALWYVCRFLEKYKNNGIPSSCAEIALRIFQKDGLRNLSLPFFERNRKERPSGVELQPHDRCYYPSLVEKIAKQIYRCCKSLYGKQKGEDGALMPDLKWAIDFLDGVYTKYTDDEWGDFRIGKLLVWSGDSVQAKERLLPVIRRKQAEFWAWDLLGDLFYSKREACVARALLCAAKEEYIKNLKQEAKQLAMSVDDKVAMSRVAEPALDLLLFEVTPKKGILLESFRTKDGKTRLVFSDGSGINIRPTSPEIVVGANGLTEGGPVFLFYTQEEDGCGLFAVKPRPTGQLWDALPIRNAVYLESFKDKNGKRISAFASNGTRFCYFDSIDGCEPGDPLAVRFSDRHREERRPECVWVTKDLSRMRKPWDESKSDVVVYYGKSRTGASYLLSSGTCKYNVPKGKFDGLTDATLGDAFRIHYVVRVKKDKERVLDVVDCQKSDERNASLVVPFVGAVEIKASQAAGATNSGLSVGYVDVFDGSSGYGHAYNLNAERRLRPSGSVFIPPELIDVHGIRNGFMVSGMAVRLPPKMHESASGRCYENKCYQAIEVRVENGDVEKGNRIEAEVRC